MVRTSLGFRHVADLMTTKHRLTRRERLALAGAAVRGIVAGVVHAALSWLFDTLTH
jgi:hypothetical protein